MSAIHGDCRHANTSRFAQKASLSNIFHTPGLLSDTVFVGEIDRYLQVRFAGSFAFFDERRGRLRGGVVRAQ